MTREMPRVPSPSPPPAPAPVPVPVVDRPSILLVDDDPIFRERLQRALRERGHDVRAAAGCREALEAAQRDPPEYVLLDLRMPDGSGLDLLRALLALDPATRVVVLTGYGSIATAVDAMRLGAHSYLPKPADADDILRAFADPPGGGPRGAAPDFAAPSLARAEWEHINRVLSDCGGNISEAARRLGIHRRSLQRKLGKYPPDA